MQLAVLGGRSRIPGQGLRGIHKPARSLKMTGTVSALWVLRPAELVTMTSMV